MIATGTAALIGLIAGTGAQVAQSVMTNRAAGKIADRQTAAASDEARRAEALAERERAYLERARAQALASYAPYMALGQNALGALSRGMGIPTVPGSGLPAFPGGGAGPWQYEMGLHGDAENAPSQNALGVAVRRGSLRAVPADPGLRVVGGASDDSVMMEAPDGRRRAVPRRKVEMYRARGARVVVD